MPSVLLWQFIQEGRVWHPVYKSTMGQEGLVQSFLDERIAQAKRGLEYAEILLALQIFFWLLEAR